MFRKQLFLVNLKLIFRFGGKQDVGTSNLLKSSVQRSVRKNIMEQYPYLTEEHLEFIMPKKSNIYQTKCPDNVTLLVVDSEPLFFQHFDGPLIPTLRLVHKCTCLC